MSWGILSWTETHPVSGAVVNRSMAIHDDEIGDKVANALRDCANVENVHTKRHDVND